MATSCVGDYCGTGGYSGPAPGDPDNYLGLTATGWYGGNNINWAFPGINAYAVASTEIFRGMNSNFNSAISIGIAGGNYFFDPCAPGIEYFYWIRMTTINGTVNDPVGPDSAIALNEKEKILSQLNKDINESYLSLALQAKLSEIVLLSNSISGEIAERLAETAATAVVLAGMDSSITNVLTFVESETIARMAGDSANLNAMNIWAAGITGEYTSLAGVVNEINIKVSPGGAIAQQIDTVEANWNGNLATVQTSLQSQVTSTSGKVSDIGALYTAKVNVNGLIGGFGIYNTGASVVAGFDVDEFWIGKSAYKVKPFIVSDGSVYINGNLFVDGTISADAIKAGKIYVSGGNGEINIGGDSSATFPFNLSAMDIYKNGAGGPAFSARGIDTEGVYATSNTIAINGIASGPTGVGVYGAVNNSSGFGGAFQNSASNKVIKLCTSSYSAYSASGDGKFYAVDGLGPFTGFHDALFPNEGTYEVGDIICDVRLAYRQDVSNTLFEVALSNAPLSKRAIGIVNDIREVDHELALPYELWWKYSHTHKLMSVNGVGEGQINVCGLNGNIEGGDYIVTSALFGKGMKQSDDIHRNTTVAKSRENVTFDYPEQVKMIACIYQCG